MHTSPQLSWITWSGCQGSFGIVPNRPGGSVISFNICQGLKCKHVASTPNLTVWLLYSNCILEQLSFECNLKGRYYITPAVLSLSLLDARSSAKFSSKTLKFLRSVAEYLAALAFLCCHYIFDSYITCLTVCFNTVCVYFHSH